MNSFPSYVESFMSVAFEEARRALSEGEVPIGCAFVLDGRQVVARAGNKVNATKNPTKHAEIVCHSQLQDKDRDFFSRVSVYVNCEPCVMCASALRQLGVGAVFYGCANPRFGGCGSVLDALNGDGDKEVILSGGHRAEEAVELLKEFYRGENPNAPEEKRKTKRN